MPERATRKYIEFNPPLAFKSDAFNRAWEILMEMRITHTVAFHYVGNHEIKGLSFETKEQAIIFKLRH